MLCPGSFDDVNGVLGVWMIIELYYYGAPGEFENVVAEFVPPMPKESYAEIAKKNVTDRPHAFNEERPAPPYASSLSRWTRMC